MFSCSGPILGSCHFSLVLSCCFLMVSCKLNLFFFQICLIIISHYAFGAIIWFRKLCKRVSLIRQLLVSFFSGRQGFLVAWPVFSLVFTFWWLLLIFWIFYNEFSGTRYVKPIKVMVIMFQSFYKFWHLYHLLNGEKLNILSFLTFVHLCYRWFLVVNV